MTDGDNGATGKFFNKDDEDRFEMASSIMDLEVKRGDALQFLQDEFKEKFDHLALISAKSPQAVADELFDMSKTQAFLKIYHSLLEDGA